MANDNLQPQRAAGQPTATDLSPVELTALAMAHQRAIEHGKDDRLVDDPLAGAFLDAATAAGIRHGSPPPALTDFFAVRTRYFDQVLLDANRQGCTQIVVLGAGLDTRAFRLEWAAGTRLFEVDLAPVLSFKASVLAHAPTEPGCRRTPVVADLGGDWLDPLRAGGLTEQPTAWLAEGLLFYLDHRVADQVITTVTSASPPGSVLAVEHVDQAMIEVMSPILAREAPGAPWRSSVEEPARWLAGHGWAASVLDHQEAGIAVGRPLALPLPPVTPEPKAWFARADR
jgi:methyltransferase (TIGR00027 family)